MVTCAARCGKHVSESEVSSRARARHPAASGCLLHATATRTPARVATLSVLHGQVVYGFTYSKSKQRDSVEGQLFFLDLWSGFVHTV